jgi:hypothetical protein
MSDISTHGLDTVQDGTPEIGDLRLKDVMSVEAARKTLGLSFYQMRYRTRRGIIKRVKLPDGDYAVLKSSVEAYAVKHEHGQ